MTHEVTHPVTGAPDQSDVTDRPDNGQRAFSPEESRASFPELFKRITANVAQVIQGKQDVIEQTLLCLVSEGHLLIEDVPGVGKTSLAKALAASLECSFGRVQFTPDVLPTDVVGVNVWNRNTGSFDFRAGPVFNHIVLGDEINRASPKTQAALLEAMEERQVTIDGHTYPLPPPFMVVATQNPIEHEGTYPLPESQLDRFLMKVSVGYPDSDSAVEILDTHGGDSPGLAGVEPVATSADVLGMAAAVKSVHIAPILQGYIVQLAEVSRRHSALSLGVSPRATLNLQRAARALAAARGRSYVVPDDLKLLVKPVLAHRILLTPETQLQGATVADVLDDILETVPVPTGREA
jgi:MoxR-like ATPase